MVSVFIFSQLYIEERNLEIEAEKGKEDTQQAFFYKSISEFSVQAILQ